MRRDPPIALTRAAGEIDYGAHAGDYQTVSIWTAPQTTFCIYGLNALLACVCTNTAAALTPQLLPLLAPGRH